MAWERSDDEQVAKLLQRFEIDAVDVVPGKYFEEPCKTTDREVAEVRTWWADRRVEITGMQALFFGKTGFNLFGSIEIQETMLQHLAEMCRIAAGLDATKLVFGSPKNRDRSREIPKSPPSRECGSSTIQR